MAGLTSRERSLSERVAVDLMHLATGRLDLSRNPIDHDEGCARIADPERRCDCSNRRDDEC